ncbi:hypothetical protein HYZ99_01130 [Candidatus Peregrinibacteria bacterium]|nr:hypothetical protein [Candidatus Peregrinibacteria bacterium]
MQTTPIVGHKLQIENLLEDLSGSNVSHAYLFAGPRHVGKFTVAKWFAKTLLTSGAKNPEAAQAISDQVDRLIHPDLFVLDQLWIEEQCEDFDVIGKSSNIPQQHRSKAKAKTDTISIEDVRVLHERLFEIGTGTWRCCLIRSIERMQTEAANALLKMLEEPPQGVVFILTTESPSAVLPTILSRTRMLRFYHLSRVELLPLVEGLEPEESHFLLRRAQGAPGIVRRLRDDPDFLREEKLTAGQAAEFWRSASLMERLQLLKPLAERGEAADAFVLHLALALREEDSAERLRLSRSLHDLIRGLKTNAQRKLLAQRFALEIEGTNV